MQAHIVANDKQSIQNIYLSLETKEQLFLIEIRPLFEYSMRVLRKILPFRILENQLLANCFQYSATIFTAKN